ncbi:PQQ-dependent sugar dehydrogenase [Nesterenkonia ebinurensis]|uniref:PQQ-dependent sugar dehydrogenase n=1 Tax=Nesterenkonia ebinurensis TaxID=2608252 RepID=UPI00123E232B|nr:PQQ-dependent sugar dehydrogenase [Nesterenkonia ebinurensis]
MRRILSCTAAAALLVAGCAGDSSEQETIGPIDSENGEDTADPTEEPATGEQPDTEDPEENDAAPVTGITITEQAELSSPWAMEFLPGTEYLLITERTGALQLRDQETEEIQEVSDAPEVDSAGQGGMHDVIAGPSFEQDQTVYLSWVQTTDDGRQGVVGRAQLNAEEPSLEHLEVIWEQDPASGNGHYSLRMVIHDDHLFVTSGDRQELEPAQDMANNLGTVVRLTLDGEPAPGNPLEDQAAPADEFWTVGHRNPLGIAVDSEGNLWSSEMGPEGGDELNLLVEGANYGWPEVSMGVHYSGEEIPDHSDDDEFEAPRAHWVPAISPGNLLIYQGELFTGWQSSALLGGLSGQNLVRVELDGVDAEQVDEWDMGDRIRALAEAPDGAIWIATDSGRLLEARPAD